MTELRPEDAYPELAAVRAAARSPVYLVGGAVRDLLLGRGRTDLDLVVVGDAAALGRALGGEVSEHPRFATAKARLGEHEIDLAAARTETYAAPGALPDVAPADDIVADLARRDFTVNAMAISLDGGELIDPFGGRTDLEARLLRVLHDRSFVDDPTRALRAGRYAARFGFALEADTERLLLEADLATVSADRRDAELLRLAREESAAAGFELLAGWGLIRLRPGALDLIDGVRALLAAPPWRDSAPLDLAVLAAAIGPEGMEGALAEAEPATPAEAVDRAAVASPIELLLARAIGAAWLDRYVGEWRDVALEIDGGDLIAAGVPEGPAVGRGLAAALRGKLDGDLSGREEELRVALAAARGEDALA